VGADLRYGRNLRVPSDNDRARLAELRHRSAENPALTNPGRTWFRDLPPRRLTSFNRYVPPQPMPRIPEATFFLLRRTHGAQRRPDPEPRRRWDLYFQSRRRRGQWIAVGPLDRLLHVSEIGGVPSTGWTVDRRSSSPASWRDLPTRPKTFRLDMDAASTPAFSVRSSPHYYPEHSSFWLTSVELANQRRYAFTLATGPAQYHLLQFPQ